jgi:hypothetical protein
VWIHPRGKSSLFQDGELVPAARQILERKAAIFAPDIFMTGEFNDAKPPGVDRRYAGFTFGYNRPLLANRVHDILTAVAYEKAPEKTTIHLVGFEAAGPWVILARALCGEMVARTAADLNGFRFENVQSNGDQMMLPGALKYGGLPAFAALCAPHELLVHNLEGCGSSDWLKAAFQATGSHDHLTENRDKVSPEKVVQWLLR